MIQQQLNEQKKFNSKDIISNLKDKLNNFFNDLINIEIEDNQIKILWFSDENVLNKQKKEQEILKNFLDFETFVLIWNKIRNYNLNEVGF